MPHHSLLTPEQSPALQSQGKTYPFAWDKRIPLRVQMKKTVRPSHTWVGRIKQPIALAGVQFDVWVSWTGLTIVLFETGEALCVKLEDFTVIAWHEKKEQISNETNS